MKSLNEHFKELEDNPRRIKIKILLDNILIQDMQKIHRMLNQTEKQIFSDFVSIYEMKCIKSVLRKLFSESVINEQTNEVENWTTKLFKNLIGISKQQTYEELMEFLKRRGYSSVFEKQRKEIDQMNLFEMENQLDKFYFEHMIKITRKHNRNLADIIGKQIDLNNIIWMYRVKKNYHFSEEQTRNILIKAYHKLRKSELEKMVEVKNEKEMKEVLQKTFYAKHIDFEHTEELEQQADKYLYEVYRKHFRGNIFDISAIYAYINMIEQENNDIMSVVEGIRYHLHKEEIQKKLIR